MIAITFALPSESSAFLRLLRQTRRGAPGSHTIDGTLEGRAVSVLHTGVGERTTRDRLPSFLNAKTPFVLISSGFAGALSDEVQVGDLLLAENYSAPHLATAAHSLPGGLRCVAGRLATAPGMIDEIGLRQEFARQEGAIAVDMETAFIAEACAAANIPMLSLRVISDTPRRPFPAPPRVLFNVERQKTEAVVLLSYLVQHPLAIGRLISFAQQVATARRSLAEALDYVVPRVSSL